MRLVGLYNPHCYELLQSALENRNYPDLLRLSGKIGYQSSGQIANLRADGLALQ